MHKTSGVYSPQDLLFQLGRPPGTNIHDKQGQGYTERKAHASGLHLWKSGQLCSSLSGEVQLRAAVGALVTKGVKLPHRSWPLGGHSESICCPILCRIYPSLT